MILYFPFNTSSIHNVLPRPAWRIPSLSRYQNPEQKTVQKTATYLPPELPLALIQPALINGVAAAIARGSKSHFHCLQTHIRKHFIPQTKQPQFHQTNHKPKPQNISLQSRWRRNLYLVVHSNSCIQGLPNLRPSNRHDSEYDCTLLQTPTWITFAK